MAQEDENDEPDRMVSAEVLGRWLDCSARTIKEYSSSGRVVKAPRGYWLQASVIKNTRHQREQLSGRGGEDLQEARRRLDEARATLAEAKAAKEKGESVSVAEVRRVWSERVKVAQSRIMAIPNRMAQLFGHLTRLELNALEAEIREALTELADGKR